jgi:hypothetical protein
LTGFLLRGNFKHDYNDFLMFLTLFNHSFSTAYVNVASNCRIAVTDELERMENKLWTILGYCLIILEGVRETAKKLPG